ncbi:MAG: hypothetical protein ACRCV3_05510 [Desulfovibrionaceae bacterium]
MKKVFLLCSLFCSFFLSNNMTSFAKMTDLEYELKQIEPSFEQKSTQILEKKTTKEDTFTDLTGFYIGAKGFVGVVLADFKNIALPDSSIKPGKFSSPVEGGGGIFFGFRLSMTGNNAPVPMYARFEFEYSQRAPYNIRGFTNALTIHDTGGSPTIDGYDEALMQRGIREVDFDMRLTVQSASAGIFFDFDTRSSVVPYLGFLMGATIFDVTMKSSARYFLPIKEVIDPTTGITTIYGDVKNIEASQTAGTLMWGIGLGTHIILNDFVMMDLGVRYLNNAQLQIGQSGTLDLKIKYDLIEAHIGISVLL